MNRLSTLILIGFAGLMASCGSSASSSTQPGFNEVYTLEVSPPQFTLNAGDFSPISATVDLTKANGVVNAVSPQPAIVFLSSDSRVAVSPAGEVCAGTWDSDYETCSSTSTLPAGYVTITAYDAAHNVSGSTLVSVHTRVASITLSAPLFSGAVTVSPLNGPGTQLVSNIPVGQYPSTTKCVSQNNSIAGTVNGQLAAVANNQVQYTATPIPSSGTIASCSPTPTPGCVYANDYTWTTDNPTVAQVGAYGTVVARNPGVTNVYATLNGTVSAPLAFVTCPPSSIVLSTSPFTSEAPVAPYSTADLDPLTLNLGLVDLNPLNLGAINKGVAQYVTATLTDSNGLPLSTSPLTYITSNPLTGSFAAPQELSFPPPAGGTTSVTEVTSKLTVNTSGRFTMMASCEPASCNPAVANFLSPAGASTGEQLGFGYPIYSNAIGVTVQGSTSSTVLVTGTFFSDGVTPAHRLLVYDSDSLALTQVVALDNLPNSLVVAPNGATAYVGSSAGLMVVNLTTYQSTLQTYPITGGLSTNVISGTVLGVSPDSRYVLVSDTSSPNPANHLVFLIDTTGTKAAVQFSIPNITSVVFAPDDSNIWIGGANGVYEFQADTFVPISAMTPLDAGISTNVTSLAWMPDGQSYFASGTQLTNYSTCNDQNPQTVTGNPTSSVPEGLSTTALSGVPHLLGLDGSTWFDYSVTSSSLAKIQTVSSITTLALNSGETGNVCLSKVTVNPPVTVVSGLLSTAQQITFSPTLEQEFVTGVNPAGAPESVIHGYQVGDTTEITLATTNPVVPLSGGILNDGSKLFFGTIDGTNALLHRIDLATRTEDVVPASVTIIPSFVAVVPK